MWGRQRQLQPSNMQAYYCFHSNFFRLTVVFLTECDSLPQIRCMHPDPGERDPEAVV